MNQSLRSIADELCDCGHRLAVHLDYGDGGYVEWKCEECSRLAWHEFQQSQNEVGGLTRPVPRRGVQREIDAVSRLLRPANSIPAPQTDGSDG